MAVMERIMRHQMLCGILLGGIFAILFVLALAGFELLYLGPAENVVRVVIWPDQPGFWEKYQTLMSGLGTVLGGAFVIVAAHVNNRASAKHIRNNEESRVKATKNRAVFNAQRLMFNAGLASKNIEILAQSIEAELKNKVYIKMASIEMAEIPKDSIIALFDAEFVSMMSPKQLSAMILAEKSAQHFEHYLFGFKYTYVPERLNMDPVSYLRLAKREAASLERCIETYLSEFEDSRVLLKELRVMSNQLIKHLTPPQPETAPEG